MTSPDAGSPGSVLRAEREALGVSVREVAETLNLSMTMIEAIEGDDHERLPGPVFARGYIRAYARLLELDAKPLLAHYPKAPDPLPPAEDATEPPIWEWIRRRPALVLGGAGGALLVLLVLVIVMLWPDDGPAQAGPDVAAAAAAPRPAAAAPVDMTPARIGDLDAMASRIGVAEAEAEPGADVRPGGADAVSPAAAAAPAVSAAETETPAVAGLVIAKPPDGAGASDAAAGPRRITAAGDDRLTFGFSDDCWVEVKSASGARLYSDLNRAGSELSLVGQGPFRILLGYAPGARLTFNGEPVPLAPHTRNNVATLVLGQ